MNKKTRLAITLVFMISIFCFGIGATLAQGTGGGTPTGIINKLVNAGSAGGFAEATTYSLPRAVGGIISVFLGILGVVFLALTVYAGYTWLTAAGNEDKVKKARGIIINAAVGLIIVVFAYAITAFVVARFGQTGPV